MVEGCLSAGLAFSFRTEITRPLSACSPRDCDRCTRRYSVSHSREQISSSPNADLETAQRPLTALATKQTALPVPQSEKTEARRSPASTPRHRLIVAAIAAVSRIFPGRKRKNTHALRALPQYSNPTPTGRSLPARTAVSIAPSKKTYGCALNGSIAAGALFRTI